MSHNFSQYFSLYWGFTKLPSAVRKAFDYLICANSPRMPLRFSTDSRRLIKFDTEKCCHRAWWHINTAQISAHLSNANREKACAAALIDARANASFRSVLSSRDRCARLQTLYSLRRKNSSKTKQHGLVQNWCFQYLSRALTTSAAFFTVSADAWRLQHHVSVVFLTWHWW